VAVSKDGPQYRFVIPGTIRSKRRSNRPLFWIFNLRLSSKTKAGRDVRPASVELDGSVSGGR
jgi:hypothetical protein